MKHISSLITLLLISTHSIADENRPAQEISNQYNENKLIYTPLSKLRQSGQSDNIEMSNCQSDKTALITIYSANGMARSTIEVKVDGSPVGNLTSYFPDGAPDCKAANARGVITLKVPAGKHKLEATSPNLNWPDHNFKINSCDCMLLPLS